MMAGWVGEGECARAAASPPSLSLFPAHPRPACRPGTRPVARPQRRPAPHPAGRGCGAGARPAGRARGARPRRRLGQNAAAAMQPTRRRRRPCDTTTGRFAVGGGPRRRRLPASQAVGCGRWDAARRTASGGRFPPRLSELSLNWLSTCFFSRAPQELPSSHPLSVPCTPWPPAPPAGWSPPPPPPPPRPPPPGRVCGPRVRLLASACAPKPKRPDQWRRPALATRRPPRRSSPRPLPGPGPTSCAPCAWGPAPGELERDERRERERRCARVLRARNAHPTCPSPIHHSTPLYKLYSQLSVSHILKSIRKLI